MPELPEVETVRRGLAPHLVGHRIAAVEVRRPDLRWPLPPDLGQVLTGATVTGLERRSKYLLAPLDRGPVLLMHLGMSGRFLVEGAGVAAFHRDPSILPRHDHLVLTTDAGIRITFNDARRFGMIDLIRPGERHPLLEALGPEPLAGDLGLAAAFRGRKAPVKQVLLDQRRVAGLGNIYVSEALHRAGRRRSRAISARCWRRRSRPAARRCATTGRRRASSAISSTASASTTARASPACARAARAPSAGSCKAGGRASSARAASTDARPGRWP